MRRVISTISLMTLLTLTLIIAPSAPAALLSSDTKLALIKVINGNISPKSVRSSGDGVASAQNIMYRHSVTIYDEKNFELIKIYANK